VPFWAVAHSIRGRDDGAAEGLKAKKKGPVGRGLKVRMVWAYRAGGIF
jgi:hypothetical protein